MRQCGMGEDIDADLDNLDVCEDDDDAVDETRRRRRFWRLNALVGAEDEGERDADDANSDCVNNGDEKDANVADLGDISGILPGGL